VVFHRRRETGEGRMFYNVTLSPGRLTLNGEARTVASCPENRPDCERTRTVATERATIRIEGSK